MKTTRRKLSRNAIVGLILIMMGVLTIIIGLSTPREFLEKRVVFVRAEFPHWDTSEVVVVIDSSVDDIDPAAREAVVAAFNEWESVNADLPEVYFTDRKGAKPSLKPDGFNTVMYAPIPFEGHTKDLAITIGFSDDLTNEIYEVDIIINASQPFSVLPVKSLVRISSCSGAINRDSCDNNYDLQAVMTHEVGHFFGLQEDRKNNITTMFSCTSPCETHKRRLSSDDTDWIKRVYGENIW